MRRLLAPALPAGVEAFVYGSMARAATNPTRPDVPPMDIDLCIVADVNAGIIDRQLLRRCVQQIEDQTLMPVDVCILDNTKQFVATARAGAAIPVSSSSHWG